MIWEKAVVGPLQCNCSILMCEKTKEAVVIDPGDEGARIVTLLEKLGAKAKYILHTHAHFDHIGGTAAVCSALKVAPCLHPADQQLYDNLPLQGQFFGFEFGNAPAIEKYLEEGEVVRFGEHSLKVIHTPGHSPGSISLLLDAEKPQVFAGDTLFEKSIGRSDLWGGDQALLLRSIREKLFKLDEATTVHPGHGPSTTIGEEIRLNPFLR